MATEQKNKQRSLTSKQPQIPAVSFNSQNQQHWVAVYFDEKFHLITPSSFDKLRKIQLEIQHQKLKLQHNNRNNKNNTKDKEKDSVNEPKQDRAKISRQDSLQSARSRQCKTEINQIKALKQKAKIQKQLVQEEENYKTKIYQTTQNRRQLRQSAAFVIRNKKDKSIDADRTSKKKSTKNFMIAPHQLTSRKNDNSVAQSIDKSKKSEVELNPIDPRQELQPARIQYMTIQVQSSQNKESKFLEECKTINVNESQRYNQNQNSKANSKQKSFVISTRKIASSNGKYSEKSRLNNESSQKEKVKSKQQIQLLTSKLKEMQQKLQRVEERQRQLEEAEKQIITRANRQKSRTSSKLNKSVISAQLEIGVDSKMVERSELTQGKKKSENKSEDQKSLAGKLKQKRMLKLAINNQIIKFNLNQDLQRQKQEQEEINKKQKMQEELNQLRKVIRHLKIDKIKQQALIKQLQIKTSSTPQVNNGDITFNGTQSKATSSDRGDILFSFKPNTLQESDRERVDQIGKIHDQKYFFKGHERKINRRILKADAIRRSEQFRFSQDFRQNEEVEEYREQENWQNPEDDKNNQDAESAGMRKGKIIKQTINIKKFEVEIENSVTSKGKSVKSRNLEKQMGIQEKQQLFTKFENEKQKSRSRKGSVKEGSIKDGEKERLRETVDNLQVKENQQAKNPNIDLKQQEALKENEDKNELENSKQDEIKQDEGIQEKLKQASVNGQINKQGQSSDIKQQEVDFAQFFKPEINVPQFQIPQDFIIPDLPTSPLAESSQVEVLNLAKKVCDMYQIKLKNNQQLQYKKYKNCVILKNTQNKAIVWHFSGKFYVGGWKENDFSQGCKEGEGFEYIPGKHYYRGQFKQGKRQGKGKMLMLNGNIYKGEFFNGERHGIGIFLEKSSNICYKGEWKQGKRDGRGIMKISNKEFYDGQFSKNSKTGFGLEVFPNGDLYIGNYKNGQFSGQGKYFWKNGSAYVGQFLEGQREGHGKWISSLNRGDIYIGFYKKDKKSGKGKYFWENGSTFEGQFVADMKHGEGMVLYEDGKIIRGVWQYGKLKSVEKLRNNEVEQINQSIQIQQRIRPNVPRIYESPSKKMQSSKWIQGV